MAKLGIFDLEKHFAFYGAYHSNPINIFIHMMFVWPVFFTALVLLCFTPSLFNSAKSVTCPCGNSCVLGLNLGFFVTLIYAAFYVLMDKKAGSLAALACLLCWVGSSILASFLASKLGFSLAWKVFCWTGQFIGHGVYEKRAPALLDNLVQPFIMAPFFVLLEASSSNPSEVEDGFIGYEPYPGFRTSVTAKIEAERKAWQDKKNKKAA
ncbi:2-hydroxy-palmitic acid dioxygenase Mpo1-like [Dillenia turbinata]|uniref:2-hydroxy-palmitic acid dioxygenase Mpo1-like n=1 Tax=Dillenia turbinata TaxID=194707 RepID=A0AAN8Z933_9MAGN